MNKEGILGFIEGVDDELLAIREKRERDKKRDLESKKKLALDCIAPLELLLEKRRRGFEKDAIYSEALKTLELKEVILGYKKWIRIAENGEF